VSWPARISIGFVVFSGIAAIAFLFLMYEALLGVGHMH